MAEEDLVAPDLVDLEVISVWRRPASYVGNGDAVSAAVLGWSYAYADKTLDDFHQLKAAAKAGEIPVADDPLR